MRAELEDWHTHKHFPERMRVPGFRRGSRWADADGGEGCLILYEMESYATLTPPEYRFRRNAATPWFRKMMPYRGNMVRSQCHVLESVGSALSRFMLTVCLSRADESTLRPALCALDATTEAKRGIASGHLLRTETPALAQTTEQKIRGGDAAADWIFLAAGYERAALEDLARNELGETSLIAAGAKPGATCGLYTLSHTNAAAEFTPTA